jgi:hypothetical protein
LLCTFKLFPIPVLTWRGWDITRVTSVVIVSRVRPQNCPSIQHNWLVWTYHPLYRATTTCDCKVMKSETFFIVCRKYCPSCISATIHAQLPFVIARKGLASGMWVTNKLISYETVHSLSRLCSAVCSCSGCTHALFGAMSYSHPTASQARYWTQHWF